MKWVTAAIVVVVLGAVGYFGYVFYTQWQAKKAEASRLAAAPPPATNAAPAEPEPPPPPKELPVLPAVWTLDVEQAKIPDGKANGTISGTNFIVETAMCTPQILGLYEGTPRSPERAILIYLDLKPGESLTNRDWTVSKDKRGKGVPQVVKEWKTNPRYAPHTKTFSSGYAMKLELGQASSNIISGKIFLALPDTEQSVVAGAVQGLHHFSCGGVLRRSRADRCPAAPPLADRPGAPDRYGRKR